MNGDDGIDVRRVRANGQDLAYQVRGSGPRPLLFLHGYSIRSTGPAYTPLFDALRDLFTVYALDMRGHGGSCHLTQDWTMAAAAADIAGVVEALELEGVVHAGHSFGGFMGLLTELLHPGTFSGLVLLAPSAASGGKATPEIVKQTITDCGRDRNVMRGLYTQMYLRDPEQGQLEALVDAVGCMEPEVHRAYFYQEYPSVVISDRLGEIQAPVLHLLGRHDSVVDPVEQHRTAAGLCRGKEVVFADEGHMLPLESPQRTAREIAAFCLHDL